MLADLGAKELITVSRQASENTVTYENAIARGDENVFFLDGETLFGNEDADLCTVDACHPNDLGHYRMAMGILPFLEKLL